MWSITSSYTFCKLFFQVLILQPSFQTNQSIIPKNFYFLLVCNGMACSSNPGASISVFQLTFKTPFHSNLWLSFFFFSLWETFLFTEFSAVKVGKEALDNIVVSMSNNEGGLYPFIDTNILQGQTVKKGDICYSKKTHFAKSERSHKWGRVFQRFAYVGISISAFLHIAIFVCICSSSPTDLQGVIFFCMSQFTG